MSSCMWIPRQCVLSFQPTGQHLFCAGQGPGHSVCLQGEDRPLPPPMDGEPQNGWDMPASEVFQEACPGGYGIHWELDG